jgi:hypothetical protein
MNVSFSDALAIMDCIDGVFPDMQLIDTFDWQACMHAMVEDDVRPVA